MAGLSIDTREEMNDDWLRVARLIRTGVITKKDIDDEETMAKVLKDILEGKYPIEAKQ